MATKLTKNFTLEELTYSSTAVKYGIKNTPNASVLEHLKELATTLQSLRDFYGRAITVSSGYRCPAVNTKVGGATTSQHMTGYAADIKPSDGNMAAFKEAVLNWAKTNKYDQIILEQCDSKGIPQWIHLGCKHATKGMRKQKLTAKKVNGKWVYNTL